MRSMDYLVRAARFLGRNIFRNPSYLIWYLFAYYRSEYRAYASFYTDQELDDLLARGKSLIRIGDGEIYIMNFGSVAHYENFNPELRRYLSSIINEYSPESPYVIGLPQLYVDMSNAELRKRAMLRCWLPLKIMVRHRFPKAMKYFDAHIFYRNGTFTNILEKHLKPYRVIIVTRKFNIDLLEEAGIHSKLNVTFIETKESGTFADRKEIMARIREMAASNTSGYRILFSAGPASKAMIYDLSREGFICYDLGKGIEAVYRKNEIESQI